MVETLIETGRAEHGGESWRTKPEPTDAERSAAEESAAPRNSRARLRRISIIDNQLVTST